MIQTRSINARIVGAICAVVVFAGVLILINSFDLIVEGQDQRNYNRFVQNVDGLTITFRQQVEECAQKKITLKDDECLKEVEEEYRVQFGSLIKLFGYQSSIQELYQYWQADLQYWYDAKKIQLEYAHNPEIIESEINRLSEIRENAVQARLQAEFAQKVESNE